jgi:lantibiotic biosynthesis protein
MSSDDAFLGVAAAIGQRIVSEAVWHGGRCSWVGAVAEPALAHRAELRALGPDLYEGTAGVGLFLAQLGCATGEDSFRTTAVGALRHAVARAAALAPERRDGLHAGSLGIAWAATRVALLLGVQELHAGARGVLTRARPAPGPGRCPDLVQGGAGSVVGLLALAEAFDDARLVEEATATGDELLEGATVRGHGWSWAIPGRRWPHHLCGASHGAAGIGGALLELFAVTGEERFRAGAAGAFSYERSWLDPGSGTWPDLRIGGQRRGARQIASAVHGTWCHGEAGIALSRLRAIAVLGPGPHGHDAEVALETTRAHLAAALPYEIEDLSLCHGAAGAADVLLSGAAALDGRWHSAADLAADLGRVALERHTATNDDWPCGTTAGTAPGLFRGLSGIAWLFLRLHDRATPSPLAPWGLLTPGGRRT